MTTDQITSIIFKAIEPKITNNWNEDAEIKLELSGIASDRFLYEIEATVISDYNDYFDNENDYSERKYYHINTSVEYLNIADNKNIESIDILSIEKGLELLITKEIESL